MQPIQLFTSPPRHGATCRRQQEALIVVSKPSHHEIAVQNSLGSNAGQAYSKEGLKPIKWPIKEAEAERRRALFAGEAQRQAVLPVVQLVKRRSATGTGVAMIGCEVIASLHLDAKMGPVACFSQNIIIIYSYSTLTFAC